MKSFIRIALFGLVLVACSRSPTRPKFNGTVQPCSNSTSPCKDKSPASQGPGAVDAVPGETPTSSDGFTSARLWRLSVRQFSNTVMGLLGIDSDIAAKFDKEARPEDGFGNDSGQMKIDALYASNLETIVSGVLKEDKSKAALKKLISCEKYADCIQKFVEEFGHKSFRRPLVEEEVKRYVKLYTDVSASLNPDEGLAAVVEAFLRSPNTQFRSEIGAAVNGVTGLQQLSGDELATQLAYAVTNRPPDAELLAATEAGELGNKAGFKKNLDRLMKSEGFRDNFVEFVFRWTGLSWLDEAEKSKDKFPDYSADVRKAMIDEARTFVSDNLKNKKGSFDDFMTGTESTITKPMAKIYGLPEFEGSKTYAAKAGERAGFFTLPAVVAANSQSAQTGPIHRGIFFLKKLACKALPPPPPVESNIDKADPKLTIRQRFELHASNPQCVTCHKVLDPYGFSMEHFDPIGRYRTDDEGKAIDATGTVQLDTGEKVSFQNGVELLNSLAKKEDVQKCFVRNAFRYVFGRAESAADDPLIDEALKRFKDSELDMREVFATIYASDQFRFRKGK